MTYREKEMEAYLYGIRNRRGLAHRCFINAKRYRALGRPDYAEEEIWDAKRHYAQARWYLDSARMAKQSVWGTKVDAVEFGA